MGLAWQADRLVGGWAPRGEEPRAQNLISFTAHTATPARGPLIIDGLRPEHLGLCTQLGIGCPLHRLPHWLTGSQLQGAS